MRRLPWRSTLRASRKGTLTAVAMSLIAAFALSGFSLAGLLEGETIESDGRFGRIAGVVADNAPPGPGETRILVKRLALTSGDMITLVRADGLEAPAVEPGRGVERRAADAREVVFRGGARLLVLPGGHEIGAADWIIVHDVDWERLVGDDEPDFALRIIPGDTTAASRVPGVAPFIEASGREVGRGLFLAVGFSSVLVALFSFEFMASEVRERRREIAVWRSVGMRRAEVRALLLGRAAAVGALALLLGASLTMILLSVASRAGNLDDLGAPPARTTLAVCASILGSCLLGALVPAARASRTPVRDALEAPA